MNDEPPPDRPSQLVTYVFAIIASAVVAVAAAHFMGPRVIEAAVTMDESNPHGLPR